MPLLRGVLISGLLLSLAPGRRAAGAPEPLRLVFVEKPADAIPDRRAREQPRVPKGWRELPFIETNSEPELTDEERARGYVIFRRPITEVVYPGTRPAAEERCGALVAFATPGEFEPVTFSIYPTRQMQNLKVRPSALKRRGVRTTPLSRPSRGEEIPASQLDVRLVTCWNLRYPRYKSDGTYRPNPELLEKANVHSGPAGECLRWWIRIHVPEDARPGLYEGDVKVFDDGYERAVSIPVALRVMGFTLKKDPKKHFSAYYYEPRKQWPAGADPEWLERAKRNEYRAMVEYGFDLLPTVYLRLGKDGRIFINDPEEIGKMLDAGMTGPAVACSDRVIRALYKATTPGGSVGPHWRISRMPPASFYARATEAFRAFEAERKEKGWPEFVYGPLDEASAPEFGAQVYRAVKEAGLRTYITKNPKAADARSYAPFVNIWCSQPFSVPYEEVAAPDKPGEGVEFWSYPNHVAGEKKDPLIMCKGGRMTYGFGLWRSGYATLIPWHWRWLPGGTSDRFDYLRSRHSGCGQRIDDDGTIIPAVYWECFREGYDDGRYIYTLEQAVVERERSADPACRGLVRDAKALLQSVWDSIPVRSKYEAEGMWPSEEFDAVRWQMARMIEKLVIFAVSADAAENKGVVAPSVIVDAYREEEGEDGEDVLRQVIRGGRVDVRDLGDEEFALWRPVNTESSLSVTDRRAHRGDRCLEFRIRVDHQVDGGGEGGHYPVGWPRVRAKFAKGSLDLSEYDYFTAWVMVDSDRDEVADDDTPFSVSFASHRTGRTLLSKGILGQVEQRVWIPVIIPTCEVIDPHDADRPWEDVSAIQFFIAERQYEHGTNLTFHIDEIWLVRMKAPTIRSVEVRPGRRILLPAKSVHLVYDLLGARSAEPGRYAVRATLRTRTGLVVASRSQDLVGTNRVTLDASRLGPGRYAVELLVEGAGGTSWTGDVEVIPGPLY